MSRIICRYWHLILTKLAKTIRYLYITTDHIILLRRYMRRWLSLVFSHDGFLQRLRALHFHLSVHKRIYLTTGLEPTTIGSEGGAIIRPILCMIIKRYEDEGRSMKLLSRGTRVTRGEARRGTSTLRSESILAEVIPDIIMMLFVCYSVHVYHYIIGLVRAPFQCLLKTII